jgi:hypothetical protein
MGVLARLVRFLLISSTVTSKRARRPFSITHPLDESALSAVKWPPHVRRFFPKCLADSNSSFFVAM